MTSHAAILSGETVSAPNAQQQLLALHRATVQIIRFVLWAQAQDQFPSAGDVVKRFGIPEASAARLIEALREAYNLPPLLVTR